MPFGYNKYTNLYWKNAKKRLLKKEKKMLLATVQNWHVSCVRCHQCGHLLDHKCFFRYCNTATTYVFQIIHASTNVSSGNTAQISVNTGNTGQTNVSLGKIAPSNVSLGNIAPSNVSLGNASPTNVSSGNTVQLPVQQMFLQVPVKPLQLHQMFLQVIQLQQMFFQVIQRQQMFFR